MNYELGAFPSPLSSQQFSNLFSFHFFPFPLYSPTYPFVRPRTTQSTFYLLHWLKGAPFDTMDQGEAARLTQWEQITRPNVLSHYQRFFIAFPVIVYVSRWRALGPDRAQVVLVDLLTFFSLLSLP